MVFREKRRGEGRVDVLIKPRYVDKPGAVLELKVARQGEKTIEKAMAEGLQQLEAKDYAADLHNAGVKKIAQMVVVFDGKRAMVLPKGAKLPKKSALKKASGSIEKAAKKVAAKAKKKRR